MGPKFLCPRGLGFLMRASEELQASGHVRSEDEHDRETDDWEGAKKESGQGFFNTTAPKFDRRNVFHELTKHSNHLSNLTSRDGWAERQRHKGRSELDAEPPKRPTCLAALSDVWYTINISIPDVQEHQ